MALATYKIRLLRDIKNGRGGVRYAEGQTVEVFPKRHGIIAIKGGGTLELPDECWEPVLNEEDYKLLLEEGSSDESNK